jgi:hypothetical protein
MRCGHRVAACGTLLNLEAPGSYKIIYTACAAKIFRRTTSLDSKEDDMRPVLRGHEGATADLK